jgi:hypothetical protein
MDHANELKEWIERERRTGAGHGTHPFSADLRRRTIAHIRDERRQGAADHVICAALGVSQQTLRRWAGPRPERSRPRRPRGALVPVSIARPVPQPSVVATPMLVAGPLQMRVGGLTLDELVELWRRLAC